MELGLILTGGSARADLDLAVRAERAGFASVFTIEFFNRHGYVPLGAIAHATSRVRLGTAIANSFTRSPLLHASAAMDLDELSDGRMVVGLGSATRRMNEDWYGVPFEAPAPRTIELVELLRALFRASAGGGFKWEGRYWNLNVPIYSRPEAVRDALPIWIAAVNRGMIDAAGSVADGLVGHPIATRRWHEEVTLPRLRAAEERAGRDAGACKLVPYVVTSIQPTREEALADAKNQIGFYYTTALYHSILAHQGMEAVGKACQAAFRKLDFKAMAAAVPDSLVDDIAIACTPDEARDRLTQWESLTDEPLLYAPTVGVRPERLRTNHELTFEVFGTA
jgi:probable F420-dependent oxidoreductase